jgi:DNA modification methylase
VTKMNKLIHSECNEFMDSLPDNLIDLTVTSPPYDKLRKYNGFIFDFDRIANNLYRITKDGGVVVWVVGDQTVKGSETGTSFRQALYFMQCGFKLHDTMIWNKVDVFGTAGNPAIRYQQSFEYIFVFIKGKIKTCNLIKIPTLKPGKKLTGKTRKNRQSDGDINEFLRELSKPINPDYKIVNNIFSYPMGFNKTSKRKNAFKHPAVFPDKLAEDNIHTWSNPGDLVFDPFSGSGTTCVEAKKAGRFYLGCDISEQYVKDAQEDLDKIEDITCFL